MNSKVVLRDLATGEHIRLTLVFPASPARVGRCVPVLSPLGMALLGCRAGQVLDRSESGCYKQLLIEGVEYQPEAKGNFFM
jgi:regulator of nucleoside diphosphate kinase